MAVRPERMAVAESIAREALADHDRDTGSATIGAHLRDLAER